MVRKKVSAPWFSECKKVSAPLYVCPAPFPINFASSLNKEKIGMHLVRDNIRNFIKHVWMRTQPDMGGCDTAPQIFWGKLCLFAVGRDLQKPCTNGQIWVWWTIPYIWGAQLQNPVRVVPGRVNKNRCQGTNKVLGIFFFQIQNKKYFESLCVNISYFLRQIAGDFLFPVSRTPYGNIFTTDSTLMGTSFMCYP